MRIASAVLISVAATPASAGSVVTWRSHVEEASARFGVPVPWIERVMHAESRGHTTLNGRLIISRAGAMGLMQLMPGTWAEMRAQLGLGRDPHHPRDNILAGTLYLRLMYDRFGYPGLFGAYNAGPARYARHLATGRPLPGETRAYLAMMVEEPFVAWKAESGNSRHEPVSMVFFALRSSAVGIPSVENNQAGMFIALGRK